MTAWLLNGLGVLALGLVAVVARRMGEAIARRRDGGQP